MNRRLVTTFLCLLCALALSYSSAPAETFTAPHDIIGSCNNPGPFASLMEEVIPEVKKLHEKWAPMAKLRGKKLDEARAAYEESAEEFTSAWGAKGVEVIVRMPEPHLTPVFLRLARSDKWYLRMRALYWLGFMAAQDSAEVMWENTAHENSLVREIAAIWLSRALDPKLFKKEYSKKFEDAIKAEQQPFVRSALTASCDILKAGGTLEEMFSGTSKLGEGERIYPYITSWKASDQTFTFKSSDKSGKAGKLAVTSGWSYPTSGFHRKIIAGLSSVPFGGLKTPTVYHLGEDVSWFEEGAGIYAIADGVVRLGKSGSDWGSLVVVEHQVDKDEFVCALYGHSGPWLFVKPGDSVTAGQLIGTIGLSFSHENGGHGSHSHFGIFKGKFNTSKCVGYRPVTAGLDDFHDPFKYLDERVQPGE